MIRAMLLPAAPCTYPEGLAWSASMATHCRPARFFNGRWIGVGRTPSGRFQGRQRRLEWTVARTVREIAPS